MQHSKTNITELFSAHQQYLIPIFQRGYVWSLEHQVKLLWEDIADRTAALGAYREKQRVVSSQEMRPLQKHFLGTLVLSRTPAQGFGYVPILEVIDGQPEQSLTYHRQLDLADAADEFVIKQRALQHQATGDHQEPPVPERLLPA